MCAPFREKGVPDARGRCVVAHAHPALQRTAGGASPLGRSTPRRLRSGSLPLPSTHLAFFLPGSELALLCLPGSPPSKRQRRSRGRPSSGARRRRRAGPAALRQPQQQQQEPGRPSSEGKVTCGRYPGPCECLCSVHGGLGGEARCVSKDFAYPRSSWVMTRRRAVFILSYGATLGRVILTRQPQPDLRPSHAAPYLSFRVSPHTCFIFVQLATPAALPVPNGAPPPHQKSCLLAFCSLFDQSEGDREQCLQNVGTGEPPKMSMLKSGLSSDPRGTAVSI